MGCSGDKISTDARRNPTSAEKQNHMQQKLCETRHTASVYCENISSVKAKALEQQ